MSDTTSVPSGARVRAMLTLMRKELRELALPALAVVLSAVVVAAMDVIYVRFSPSHQEPGIALTVWLVLAVPIALFGGSAVFARETRQRMIFLTSWPVSRAQLWLAKSLVSFVLIMAAIVAGFAICLVGLRLSHAAPPQDFAGTVRQLSWAVPAAFALGLMWSGLVGSVLGAGVAGFVTGCVVAAASGAFFVWYLPRYWSPYLGTIPLGDWVQYLGVLALIAAVTSAGAVAFAGVPILDAWRRIRRALGVLAGLTALAWAAYVAWIVVCRAPSLGDGVEDAGLSQDGRAVYLETRGTEHSSEGLWWFPLDARRPRLVCRTDEVTAIPDRDVLVLFSGDRRVAWFAALPAGNLHRLRGDLVGSSPDGRYWALSRESGEVVVRNRWGWAVATLPDNTRVVFAPDSRTVYYREAGHVDVPGAGIGSRLLALDLKTRKTTELRGAPAGANPGTISPDGKWLCIAWEDETPHWRYALYNVEAGQSLSPSDVSLNDISFVTDRYLWSPRYHKGPPSGHSLDVVELPSGRVVNRLFRDSPDPFMYPLHTQPGVPYVAISTHRRERGPAGDTASGPSIDLWLANPDGSNLRPVREEDRQILGMAADGRIILRDDRNEYGRPPAESAHQKGQTFHIMSAHQTRQTFHIISLDPLTGQEKVLLTLPGP